MVGLIGYVHVIRNVNLIHVANNHEYNSSGDLLLVAVDSLCSSSNFYFYLHKWLYTIFYLRLSAPEKTYVGERFLLLPDSTKDGFC
jgi:hypothetical protein